MLELLFGTQNLGKLLELNRLVDGLAVRVMSPAEMTSHPPHIIEDGATFLENAVKKAQAYARWSQRIALADDSGLCVDALGGAPGVQSARWSGAGDQGNNERLLRELAAVPDGKRGAHYLAVLALARPSGEVLTSVEATCRGRIARAPRGANGFGYDPLFLIPERNQTMAELSPDEKDLISHRGQAFRKLRPVLQKLAAGNRP